MIAMVLLPALTALALLVAAWAGLGWVDRRPTVRLLAALVATSAVVVVLQVLLALAGALRTFPLLAVSWIVALLVLVGRAAAGGRGDPAGIRRPTAVGVALGALAAIAYLLVLGLGLLVPPYGWDTLVYHLTDVFHAARESSLPLFPFPGRNVYYPQAGELHSLWAFLLAGGGAESWRMTGLGLLPLGLTAGVAVRAAAEGLGLRTALPWIAPAMMLTPVLLIQPLAAYVDGAFAAFLLAALAFAILTAREGRFAHLAFCALASGLALGVKISFLYFGLPVLLVLLAPATWRALSGRGVGTLATRLAICALLFVAPCGYWLGRNLLLTGNPIFPTKIQIAGHTLLDGPRDLTPSKRQQSWFVPDTASWIRYPFYETFHGKPAYTLENGFGPLFAAGFAGTLIALPLAARRRRFTLFRALLGLPITAFLFLGLNPYQEPRYVIAGCGFALIALAALTEAAAGRLRAGEENGGPEPLAARAPAPARLVHAAAIAGIVFSAVGGVASAAPDVARVLARFKAGDWSPKRYYPLQYGAAGEAFNWISDGSGEGKTVTFTHSAFIAPLFGWHGRNRVVYASTGGGPPYPGVFRCETYRAWRKFLHDHRVEWIVVWLPWWAPEPMPKTQRWIEENPHDFELLREFGGRARVYRPVISAPEADAIARWAPGGPDVADLGAPAAWHLEYREGTEAVISAGDGGGLRIDYAFGTARNDYCDFRADLEDQDWSRVGSLSFEIDPGDPSPVLVFVYLKERDPRRACRFRIDLREGAAGPRRVTLDLASPDWSTGGFDPGRIGEIHLVLDDAEDADAFRGSLRLRDFRVELRDAGGAPPGGEGHR